MSAELEEARALGRARQTRLATAADDRLCRVGRRGAGPARLDRVGRAPRAGAARQGGRLHQHRRQRPRLPQRRRLARARGVRQQRRARHRGSRDEGVGLEAHAGARDRQHGAGTARRGARDRRPADRRARFGIRLLAVPAARRHPVAQPVVRRARSSPTGSITRFTTTTTTSRSSSTPTSPMAGRWRRRSAPLSSGWPTPT